MLNLSLAAPVQTWTSRPQPTGRCTKDTRSKPLAHAFMSAINSRAHSLNACSWATNAFQPFPNWPRRGPSARHRVEHGMDHWAVLISREPAVVHHGVVEPPAPLGHGLELERQGLGVLGLQTRRGRRTLGRVGQIRRPAHGPPARPTPPRSICRKAVGSRRAPLGWLRGGRCVRPALGEIECPWPLRCPTWLRRCGPSRRRPQNCPACLSASNPAQCPTAMCAK